MFKIWTLYKINWNNFIGKLFWLCLEKLRRIIEKAEEKENKEKLVVQVAQSDNH